MSHVFLKFLAFTVLGAAFGGIALAGEAGNVGMPAMSCQHRKDVGYDYCTGAGAPRYCQSYPGGTRGCCEISGQNCQFYYPVAVKAPARAPVVKTAAQPARASDAADDASETSPVQANMVNY